MLHIADKSEPQANTPDLPGATSPLQVLARRWPWLVLGVIVGTIGGFFWYTTRPEVFQSRTQVLVMKKRSDLAPTMDSRTAVVEDYVATQLTLIRSEKILNFAAKQMPESLHNPLPGSDMDKEEHVKSRSAALKGMLDVTRDKDSATSMGTNILNLAIRSGNPEDARSILTTIVSSYREQLRSVFNAETERKINEYKHVIKECNDMEKDLGRRRIEARNNLLKITPEDPMSLRARLSQSTLSIRSLEVDLRDLESRLNLIKNTGPDTRDRRKVLNMLGDTNRDPFLAKIDMANPDAMIRSMQLERADLAEKYGDEHPIMRQLDAKIKQLTALNVQMNPQSPKGDRDPLEIMEQVLDYKVRSLSSQLTKVRNEHKQDLETLKLTSSHQSEIELFDLQLTDIRKRRNENEVQLKLTQTNENAGGFDAITINEPTIGGKVEPKLSTNIMYGLILGLVAGIGLASVAEMTDRSFKSPAEIRVRLGVPVIGHVPTMVLRPAVSNEEGIDSTIVTAIEKKSPEAEAYRGVRTTLFFSSLDKPSHLIQITSPNPGDGKSTLAANLAVSIAQSGKKVILVDADLRRPRVHKLFNLEETGPGVVGILSGESTLEQSALSSKIEHLSLLPCGTRPSNPAELLASSRFSKLLDELRVNYEYVILDTPPLLAVSDPAVTASRVDSVIMVFRMTRTVRPAAERAKEILARMGNKLIGVVVNGTELAVDGYGYGYSYESKYYHDDDSEESLPKLPQKG